MPKAAILTDRQIEMSLHYAGRTGFPDQNRLIFHLAFQLGLRSQEVAYLCLEDFTDAQGQPASVLRVSRKTGKYGKERDLPLPPWLRHQLGDYARANGIFRGPLFWTRRGRPITPGGVQTRIRRIFEKLGFKGASSHSGRRTCITRWARNAVIHGASLRDVQLMAGHASPETTLAYVEPSENQAEMVAHAFNLSRHFLIPPDVRRSLWLRDIVKVRKPRRS